MHILKFKSLPAILLIAGSFIAASCGQEEGQKWEMKSLSSIGGNRVEVLGNPEVVEVESGEPAIEFDGTDDGVLVAANPIEGADEFTIQMVFKPYGAYPENIEQRFLHIQDPEDESRRILMELRLNNRQEWYPDFYMKADTSSLVLIDSTLTFPVNEWATMRLVYKNGQMKGFVNGKELLSGKIKYLPIGPSGQTSIGTRMDKRSWFYGAIKSIEFKPRAVME